MILTGTLTADGAAAPSSLSVHVTGGNHFGQRYKDPTLSVSVGITTSTRINRAGHHSATDLKSGDLVNVLARAWNARWEEPPQVVVLALSRDKPAAAMAGVVARCFPGALVVATASRNALATDPEEIASAARALGLAAQMFPDVARAVGAALARVVSPGRVLLTGSLFAVGEAMEAYGGEPGEML